MKNSLAILCVVSLLLIPLVRSAYTEEPVAETPPVAQTLVREGDFAVKLVEALKLGNVSSEAEAESTLAAAGIAPRNGWIASYPVTPDILGELRGAVGEAAEAGRLAMGKDEAVDVLQTLAAEEGLPVVSETSGRDPGKEPERGTSSPYSDPTVVNNYYYNEGPPVVTYYPPPWDYHYMYSWVPHPFWWHSFFFSGFFVLHDFNRVVVVKKNVIKVVSNHVYDPATRRVSTVNPVTRTGGRRFEVPGSGSPARGFASGDARRGAASIVERSRERGRSGNGPAAITNRGNSVNPSGISGSGGRREGFVSPNRNQSGSQSQGGTDGGFERRRFETGRNEMGARSFNRPDLSSGNRGSMSLGRSPGGGRGTVDPGNRGDRSFRSFSGSGGSFSSPSTSGGRRGMGFERPAPRMDRSFSAPSIRAPSPRGGGSVQGLRGGGSNSGGGGFSRGRSSGGGCRGRC